MINVEHFADAEPEVYAGALQAGDYDVLVQSATPGSTQSGGGKVSFDLLVSEGPMQTFERKDGSTYEVSPIDRHIFYDQTLPAASHSDGGKFCASRLAKICEVLDVVYGPNIDEQEFVGKRCRVRLSVVTKDKDGNALVDPRNDIKRWIVI